MSIQLRPPSTHTLPSAKAPTSTLSAPTAEWMTGTWHVTHSTLPMWKSKSNVRITYTPLASTAPPTASNAASFDDLVEYKKTPGGKDSSVHGVSKIANATGLSEGWAFSWRGKGWLAIASSKWEVLGYGAEEAGNGWAVTYFSKTLFTPAGIDVYSRSGKVEAGTLEAIKAEFEKMEDPGLKKLAGEIFEIATPV